jgi:hypothetical protein
MQSNGLFSHGSSTQEATGVQKTTGHKQIGWAALPHPNEGSPVIDDV